MFELLSEYKPSPDQRQAIDKIVAGVKAGVKYQTLLGVTGSGKTFTMANVIKELGMKTLIMSHNKSLCAQLYSEFKGFFANNHVEYFISYYDYYQPEAYIPRTDTFIEKDSAVNNDLERLRLSAGASLLSFDDCVCIASVSANYGLGNPAEYVGMTEYLKINNSYPQKELLNRLVQMGYSRNNVGFDRGDFRVHGDVIDIFPAYYEDDAIRLEFFGDELEAMYSIDVLSCKKLRNFQEFTLYAANQFIVGKERLMQACSQIQTELNERLEWLKTQPDSALKIERLSQRVNFDLEMLEATGICKGIENYARYLSGLNAGDTPYTLFDYFAISKKPFLVIVDESHVSLPQFRGMFAGDRARKEVLVEYGFRLPSALDNRPLMFNEFINKDCFFLFVSATPAALELELSGKYVYEQIMRPTGLLDPLIEVVDSANQIEHLHDEIKRTVANGERVLITTLTKKMSEELTKYYTELGINCRYMHSEIDAIERNELIRALRDGEFDVLIGINLLREGLDLPEVSLVAILDADKEGFLRSYTALIQTMGRAARNEHGRVIFYAAKTSAAMAAAIETTQRRRALQQEYNKAHNITPRTVKRRLESTLRQEDEEAAKLAAKRAKAQKLPAHERAKLIAELRAKMSAAAKTLDFEQAAFYRDEIKKLQKL